MPQQPACVAEARAQATPTTTPMTTATAGGGGGDTQMNEEQLVVQIARRKASWSYGKRMAMVDEGSDETAAAAARAADRWMAWAASRYSSTHRPARALQLLEGHARAAPRLYSWRQRELGS